MLLFLVTPFLVVAGCSALHRSQFNWDVPSSQLKKIKCVLQVFVNQVVTSESQNKNLNILRTKRAFKVKQKPFFIFFKRVSFAKSLKPDSTPWKWKKLNKWTHYYIERGQLLNYFNWMFNYFLWIVFVCFKEKAGAFT